MIVGDVYVQRGNHPSEVSILKIHPGTVVKFGSDDHLYVGHQDNDHHRGALQADGVTFTRLSEEGYWPHISFRHMSVDEQSYLDNCVIEYANDGVYCASSDPTITNSTFRYNIDGVEADEGAYPILSLIHISEPTRPY